MKKIFFYLMVAMLFTACNNSKGGEEVTAADSTMTVDSLLGSIETLVGQQITVIGRVDHVCKHGGTKMVIYTSNPENGLHINATDESGNFRADEMMDETVRVVGKVSEFRVDDGYIAELESVLETKKAEGPSKEEPATAKKEEHHDGNFPDADSKHKQEVEGLENQITRLKTQLEEARANGKDHLSFYSVDCVSYSIVEGSGKIEASADTTVVDEPVGHQESAVEMEADKKEATTVKKEVEKKAETAVQTEGGKKVEASDKMKSSVKQEVGKKTKPAQGGEIK